MAEVDTKRSDFLISSALSCRNLDLSKKELSELPPNLPGCEKLECLYLEGNKLKTVPESLFMNCPNLQWLDLRNNQLTFIPPSIEKLRHLRTILLEGNCLTHLPPQLCKLHHLTGLNLSNNPLEMPPNHVIQKGTKEILKYLRKMLNEGYAEGEDDLVGSNSMSGTTVFTESRLSLALASTDNNTFSTPSTSSHHVTSDPKASQLGVQLPVLPQIQIPPSHSRHQSRKTNHHSKAQAGPSDQHNAYLAKKRLKLRKKFKKEITLKHPELTTEEKLEISVTIEKKKAEDSLATWRDKAKEMQRKQSDAPKSSINYQEATAPFATDSTVNSSKDMLSEVSRLKINDRQQASLSVSSTDTLRDLREAEVNARVNKHMLELEAVRKQTGLITTPSNELLEAEKKLAEAIVRHKELEKEKAREYRLTAFTGDLL